MALATAWGAVLAGISGEPVRVEAEVTQGLPGMSIVGLAGTSVSEARWRVRSAMEQMRWPWPNGRITVSLSPAEMPKHGTSLDLAIAVAIHTAQQSAEWLSAGRTARIVFIGELGLDGTVRAVRGALAMTVAAARSGVSRIIVPQSQWSECSRVPNIEVMGVSALSDVAESVTSADVPSPDSSTVVCTETEGDTDWLDIQGQESAKWAATIAAVGGHHLALFGTPGLGKSMIAHRFVQILPDLSPSQAVEVMAIHSLSAQPRFSTRPPVEMPHHSASPAAVLGTSQGQHVVPGAVTRAHGGVLILDEVPEFARSTLEGLRQPWESGHITVHRAGWSGVLPARIQVVMTANPCPCGWHGVSDGARKCSCAPHAVRTYQSRLSGPLMDRVDVRVSLRPEESIEEDSANTSAHVRHRVAMARERTFARWGHGVLNGWVPITTLRRHTELTPPMERHVENLARTGRRGVDRVLRLAWSLCDLHGDASPTFDHVLAATSVWGNRHENQ